MPLELNYERLNEQQFGRPTRSARVESDADLFTQGRGFMGAFDLTMQIQVGCPAGCLFCYVRTGFRLAPSAVQKNWGVDVRTKRNVVDKLQRHLDRGDLADKTLYWSGVTDPYAAAPAVTRQIWQALSNAAPALRPRRIAVQTRFRPDRDSDQISAYCGSTTPSDGGPPVVISYSIGTDRDDLIRAWEKTTPSFESRMHAVESLRAAGIFVVATLSPFGVWRDLPAALGRFNRAGVAYVTVLFFKERTGATTTPKPFLAYLRDDFPFLLDADWQAAQILEIKRALGEGRVLVGQPGFASLANPHRIIAAETSKS